MCKLFLKCKNFPTPGVEPGPPGWKPDILAVRPRGSMFSPGIEPGTFCVLDRCDNRYTTKTHWHLQIIQPWHAQPGSLVAECARPNITRNPIAVLSRDRLVVRTLRCGRSNPGSNPGHGMDKIFLIQLFKFCTKKNASAGNRTRINCLEGSYADHYTTDAYRQIRIL